MRDASLTRALKSINAARRKAAIAALDVALKALQFGHPAIATEAIQLAKRSLTEWVET